MSEGNIRIPTPYEIQQVTEKVLSRPEFNRLRAASEHKEGWLERFFDWAGSLRLFESGSAAGTIFKILLIALFVFFVIYFIRLLLTGSRLFRSTRKKDGTAALSIREKSPSGDETGGSLRHAEQALNRGDIRLAVRILYRTFIRMLSQKGFLKLERWKTNLAYLRECPQDIEQFPLLQELTLAHDNVVYAHFKYNREKISQFVASVRRYGEQG
jgi:hypothetical protein